MTEKLSNLLQYFYYYDPETGQETNNIDYEKLIEVLEDIIQRIQKLEEQLS